MNARTTTLEARVMVTQPGCDPASVIASIALNQTQIRIPFIAGEDVYEDGSTRPVFGMMVYTWDGDEVDDDGRPVFR
jgi:hypothetical protein